MPEPKLSRLLSLELKRGCKNDAVIGGLDRFIFEAIESEPLTPEVKEKLRNIFKIYRLAPQDIRKIKLKEALELIHDSDNKVQPSEEILASDLFKPVQYVKGVGPKIARPLNKLGIEQAIDLLYYFPRDYIDLRKVQKIALVNSGESVVLKVRVVKTNISNFKFKIFNAVVTDGTGYVTAVWFNQSYLKNIIKEGMQLILQGKIQYSYGKWEMPSPEYEILQEGKETVHSLRIVPIYSLTEGISQKVIRNKIKSVVDELASRIRDYIDPQIKQKYQFLPLNEALVNIHFPDDFKILQKAKERLVFDELFELQILLGMRKTEIKSHRGIVYKASLSDIEEFEAHLQFKLTSDQKNAMKDIIQDITSGKPMNRLLHGDVGSGKTAVSLFSMYLSKNNGLQSVMMSPTEILAQQTFSVAERILEKYGLSIALLTSSTTKKERNKILEGLLDGSIDAVFGTHALIEEDVRFKKLGIVIVDEQHRFGVLQRGELREKATFPHTLVMSATPIPRTLALTLYGDLDISQILEMPKGRKPILTKVYFEDESEAYSHLISELKKGNKGYVVCPLIEESESELVSVMKRSEELKETYLKNFKIGVLHGQMSGQEKDQIMQDFKNGKIQVVVSTTVVEVGVDVRDATVIIVEDADRFGLATLHQLRGRVGRSDIQSFCYLITRNANASALDRLRILERTTNGFEVSEEDLRLRGPGEILGTKQHGLPELKLTTLLSESDLKLLEIARTEALKLLNREVQWDNENIKELNKLLEIKFRGRLNLIEVA